MQLYELTNPSDTITFWAKDYKTAFTAGLIAGEGRFAVHNKDRSEDGPLFLFGSSEKYIKETFNTDLTGLLNDTDLMKDVFAALDTFAYASFESRDLYDKALESIADPVEKLKFKQEQEDTKRTSMARIVQHAWNLGRVLEKQWGADAKTQS